MRIIGREIFEFDQSLEVVFHLGREFTLENTNLFNILPNLGGRASILTEHGDDLKKLCPFYHVESPFLTETDDLPEKALYLFLLPAPEDAEAIGRILDRIQGQPAYLLAGTPETAYALAARLQDRDIACMVPGRTLLKPLRLKDVPEEENPLYFSDLFGIRLPERTSLVDFLKRLFGLEGKGGRLYEHLENALADRKGELEELQETKLSIRSLELAWEKFRARNLSIREQLEKATLEGNYAKLPILMKTLLYEDPGSFGYAYDLLSSLNGKLPAETGIGILEEMIAFQGEAIDKIYLPLVYDKLAVLSLAAGSYRKAAEAYRAFCSRELARQELSNIRSNFLRKEMECSFLAGDFDTIIGRGEQLLYGGELQAEDRVRAFSYLAMALNEKGRYDEALVLAASQGLVNKEMLLLKNLLLRNAGQLQPETLDAARQLPELAGNPRAHYVLDTLKALLLIRSSAPMDCIKLANQIQDRLASLPGRHQRKAMILVHLLKGRALSASGYFRDSLTEYSKGIDLYRNDQEGSSRSLVLTMLQESAALQLRLDNRTEAFTRAMEGLEYEIHDTSDYDRLNRIRLQLTMLACRSKAGEDLTEITKALDGLFADQLEKPDYRKLKAAEDKLLVLALADSGKDGEARALAEESWKRFAEDTDPSIATDLLDLMEGTALSLKEEEDRNGRALWLERIHKKYFGGPEDGLHLRGGIALKDLADLRLAQGSSDAAFSLYGNLLASLEQRPVPRLEEARRDAVLGRADILLAREAWGEAREEARKLGEGADSPNLARQELLLCKCDDRSGKNPGSALPYEEWLHQHDKPGTRKRDLSDALDRLAALYAEAGRDREALEALERMISLEEDGLKRLEAQIRQGVLLYKLDKHKALDLYRKVAADWGEDPGIPVLQELIGLYKQASGDLDALDFPLFQAQAGKALERMGELGSRPWNDLFTVLRNGARTLEGSGNPAGEAWIRDQLVRHYRNRTGLEYQVEIASSLHRLLQLAIAGRSLPEAESRCRQLLEFAKSNSDAFIQDFALKGIFEMGLFRYRNKDFSAAASDFRNLLLRKETPEALFYQAMSVLGTGDRKEGLKELGRLFSRETLTALEPELRSQAVAERIRLEREDKSLFGGNLRKLSRDLREWILPGLAADLPKDRILELWCRLGELYKDLKKDKKAQELYRSLIEEYKDESDPAVAEILRTLYAALS